MGPLDGPGWDAWSQCLYSLPGKNSRLLTKFTPAFGHPTAGHNLIPHSWPFEVMVMESDRPSRWL